MAGFLFFLQVILQFKSRFSIFCFALQLTSFENMCYNKTTNLIFNLQIYEYKNTHRCQRFRPDWPSGF